MNCRQIILALLCLCALVLLFACRSRFASKKSVEDRVRQYGQAARTRLKPDFARLGLVYPPARVVLAAFKSERMLEVWVGAESGSLQFLRSYPILAASGGIGPKLRQGDRQVPEGIYRIESLNPNSRYHLSLRLNYPNEADRRLAAADGRTTLGGDIMIHGDNVSIGCLAMGDEAAEDLFVLAAETGIERIDVILSPVDFRVRELNGEPDGLPSWYPERCAELRRALSGLK